MWPILIFLEMPHISILRLANAKGRWLISLQCVFSHGWKWLLCWWSVVQTRWVFHARASGRLATGRSWGGRCLCSGRPPPPGSTSRWFWCSSWCSTLLYHIPLSSLGWMITRAPRACRWCMLLVARMTAIPTAFLSLFSCPGSSIPDLGGQWLTATLEFRHKEWL